MSKTALVLEGGAMRSLYTSGVLDVLMENNVEVDAVIGVSAGALTGANYISKQIGRSAKINIEFCDNSNYIGLKAIKNSKGLFGFNYLFNEISEVKNPFDVNAFNNSKCKFVVGATNCNTGKTEYFIKDNWNNIKKVIQASSSMPLVSSMVDINGVNYLDGAIDCNIPLNWALENEYEKIIVVLTRDEKYIKEPLSDKMKKIYSLVYKKYPELIKTMYSRPEEYNKLTNEIKALEVKGRVMVLRPAKPIEVERLEKDKEKLKELYEFGKKETKEKLEQITDYINF